MLKIKTVDILTYEINVHFVMSKKTEKFSHFLENIYEKILTGSQFRYEAKNYSLLFWIFYI